MKPTILKCLALSAALLLTGCHTAPVNIYQWGNYQPQVYQYFKGESPDQQIAALEQGLQDINARGHMPPPGYHAQLGMLYSMTGKPDLAVVQFQEEKRLFPESKVYMNFLLEKMKKG